MPLVRRSIGGSLEYGHPHLYSKSPKETILQDVNMASMTGTLAQIGLLSHYATEAFQDLFSLSSELQKRLDDATSRTRGGRAATAPRGRAAAAAAAADFLRAVFRPGRPENDGRKTREFVQVDAGVR